MGVMLEHPPGALAMYAFVAVLALGVPWESQESGPLEALEAKISGGHARVELEAATGQPLPSALAEDYSLISLYQVSFDHM